MEEYYFKLLSGFVGIVTFLIGFIFNSQNNRIKNLETSVKALESGYITEDKVRVILDDKLEPMQSKIDATSKNVSKIFDKIEQIRVEAVERSNTGKTYFQKGE